MQRPQNPRIDLAEMKLHIVKKIGVERTRRYFYYLGRFLSQKLTKSELDNSCYHLLGRENLSLHNKLISSILRNASCAKSSPHKTNHSDKSLVLGKGDGPEQSISLIPDHNRNDSLWSNGVLPKVRSGTCVETIRDRATPLGPDGKVESLLHQYPDERGGTFSCPAEKLRIPDKGQSVAPVSRADEAQEERGRLISSMSPVSAPLGIPFCSASVGGARRTVPISTRADFISYYDSGGLSDTEMLKKRMENIAVAEGLGGVSAECSSMLNNMLDVYMKKVVKSCVNLAGARSKNGSPGKQSLDKLQSRNEIVNVMQPSNSFHIQTSNQPSDITQEQYPASLLDFRVAMELNPHKPVKDWPLLWERTFMRSFEDREGV